MSCIPDRELPVFLRKPRRSADKAGNAPDRHQPDYWQVFILSKRPLDFLGFKFHPNKTTIRKSIMLRISRKARTIARAAYASIRNAHAMVSYIGYIVNSDSQRFYEKWVRPFVNIKHLKGVIADEDRKQHQACVAV